MKKYLAILLTMTLILSAAWSVSATSVDGTASESNGTVTISGSVSEPVSEQQVTILVVDGGTNINSLTASNIAYVTQAIPDNNGDYEVSFTMPVAKRTGTYDVYVGGTEVSTPTKTDLTYPTEAPTTAPEVQLGNAKPAVNGENAFYYFITITLNDGVATGFHVKHYPTDMAAQVETNAELVENQNFTVANISGATVKVISVLKGIPDTEADRPITTKATLTYTIGGNAGSVTDTESTTLNQTKQAQN